jgi:hypothetical protein
MTLVLAPRLETESFVESRDLEELAGRDLKLFGEKAQVLLREVPLLILKRVEDGNDLLGVPAITFKNGF